MEPTSITTQNSSEESPSRKSRRIFSRELVIFIAFSIVYIVAWFASNFMRLGTALRGFDAGQAVAITPIDVLNEVISFPFLTVVDAISDVMPRSVYWLVWLVGLLANIGLWWTVFSQAIKRLSRFLKKSRSTPA